MNRTLSRILRSVKGGVRPRDRALIAAYYGMLAASKPMRREGVLAWRPEFWLGDVLVDTSAGRFSCRAGTTDMAIVDDIYEPAVLGAIRGKLQRVRGHSPVFVDVGAHIGKYAVFAGRLLKDRGHVIAVEPELENFRLLVHNVELNGLDNVTTLKMGCWSKDDVRLLHKARGNLGGHSFVEDVGDGAYVQVKSLDSLAGSVPIDLIKIDVQSAELEVLQGAFRILERNRDISIVFETCRDGYADRAMRFLEAHGFKMHRLDASNHLAERAGVPR